MDGPRHERRQHFRGKARPGRILPVRFRASAEAPWIDAETRNIGVGGAFIATSQLIPAGTPLIIELRLPSTDQVFVLSAVARWASSVAMGGGMGVQFVGVDVDVLLELNDYFASLTGV